MMVTPTSNPKSVLEGTWALGAIAIVVVVLRVFAKVRLRHLGTDDALMVAALCFALAASIVFTISILVYGFASGRPGVDKPTTFKFNVIMEICNIASTCLGRVAFILYLLPVLSIRKAFKISLWVLLIVQIAANIVMIILVLTQCRDIRGIWNPEYATDCMEDTIQLYFGYFLCVCNSSADLILAVFPCYIFWDLKLKPIIKFSLMILISLGLVATVGAIMKTVYLKQILTWASAAKAIQLTSWGMIECYLVIISASVPCLRSLVVSSVRQLFASDKSSTLPFTSSYRKRTASQQHTTNRIYTNHEASGSTQNFFSGARGEEIEMGTTSVDANESDDGARPGRGGIAKTVDVNITWEQQRGQHSIP
ncbi:hypothetical protein N7465_007102 [Penicillium sp. CMV-2018d]|nr:hypothetical protein N7465_007102 [Penicillium sp. CMV-2018d]